MEESNELEKACMDAIDSNPNMTVPWYLMASYAYYEEDDPILSDGSFDRLAKKIINEWENITHMHKDFLNMDMLEAGTYTGVYPTRIKGALESVRQSYKK